MQQLGGRGVGVETQEGACVDGGRVLEGGQLLLVVLLLQCIRRACALAARPDVVYVPLHLQMSV